VLVSFGIVGAASAVSLLLVMWLLLILILILVVLFGRDAKKKGRFRDAK
jgi:cbb3-type cytochrome oxidase subunit 3